MCLIVDANVAPKFLVQSSAIIDWLFGERGNPRLVAAGKLRQELAMNKDVRRQLVQMDRAGRLRFADPERLQSEEKRLRTGATCASNDLHVLALAIVTGARTLATDDNALAADFRNKRIIDGPRGKIYRDPARHGRLLCHTSSCGMAARPKPRRG